MGWRGPSKDPLSSKVLRALGVCLGALGASLTYPTMELKTIKIAGILACVIARRVLGAIIHNLRVGKRGGRSTTETAGGPA